MVWVRAVWTRLNNYVAIHYESKHMSWLHAMWGLGMLTGPYVMGYALGHGQGWDWGYRYISIIQIVLTALLIASLPLWKQRKPLLPSIADNPANLPNPFPLHESHWASVGFCAFAAPRRS